MKINLAENIKNQRKEHSLTQEQLAEALGVTVGAVYKWERGHSVPEIHLLIEIADFFETSVDALLGYSWDTGSMGNAAKEIKRLRGEKKFDEAISLAEKALTKYPNSFEVVYQSALMYQLMMLPKYAPRSVELFERSLKLISQNPYDGVSEWTVNNKIADAYLTMGKYDKAVEILKKNNFDGVNNGQIGAILAMHCKKSEEALSYLSEALELTQASLFRIVIGYANAYIELGKLNEARDITEWMYSLTQNLREPSAVTLMDKNDVMLLVMLAEILALLGDDEECYLNLKKAKSIAERFDASPSYTMKGLKFYHGSEATAYDDFGDTAVEGIEKAIAEDVPHLRAYWERLKREGIDRDKE